MGAIAMELRIAAFRLLIAKLRKSAINNRKSSIKDDHNRDCLSTGFVEEPFDLGRQGLTSLLLRRS